MVKKTNYDNWSKEELIKEINRIKDTAYGLVWHRDKETEEKLDVLINPDAKTPNETFKNEVAGKPFPVLKEVKGKEVVTNKNKNFNILIEGDNYHSLAILNFTHWEAIDVIYIDPPYNTENKDFIYNDKMVDKDDPYRHSKWLNFMEKRIKLAKNLLKKTGIIFISIDDNEFAQLKMLCDEIFDENFYGFLTWIKRTKSTNSGKAKRMIQQKTEYILVYGKQSPENFDGFKLLYNGNKKQYPHDGKFGKCRFENLEATDYGRKKRDTMKFSILGVPPRPGRRWQLGQETALELVKQGKIELVDGVPMRAFYPGDEEEESFVPFWSHLEDTGTAETGKQELSQIIGPEHGFDTVKPTPLMRKIFERFEKDVTVLDFFAGSGTTGQALLEMNKEDGGNRKFILCTNNRDDKAEHKVATNICYPRIQKIINGYKNLDGEKINGVGGNLKYFTAYDFVEAKETDANKRKLVNKSTEMLCIKENAFELIKDEDDFKIFKNSDHYLGIVFYEEAIDSYKKAIKKMDGLFNTYVFSLGDDPHEKEFTDVKDKVVLCAIPEVILKVYREIFK